MVKTILLMLAFIPTFTFAETTNLLCKGTSYGSDIAPVSKDFGVAVDVNGSAGDIYGYPAGPAYAWGCMEGWGDAPVTKEACSVSSSSVSCNCTNGKWKTFLQLGRIDGKLLIHTEEINNPKKHLGIEMKCSKTEKVF